MARRPVRFTLLIVAATSLIVLATAFGIGVSQLLMTRAVVAGMVEKIGSRTLQLAVAELEGALLPVQARVQDLAVVLGEGGYEILGDERVDDLLRGVMAGAPQIARLVVVDESLLGTRVFVEYGGGARIEHVNFIDYPFVANGYARAAAHPEGGWAEDLFDPELGEYLVSYVRPILRDGRVVGIVGAAVSTHQLTLATRRLEEATGATSFILREPDRLLAHSMLHRGTDADLLPLRASHDPVLAAMDQGRPATIMGLALWEQNTGEHSAALIEVAGENYLFMSTEVNDLGSPPILAGFYRRIAEIDAPLRMLRMEIVLALLVAAVALLAGIAFARAVARPLRGVASSMGQIGDLDLKDIAPVPHSRIREINELGLAFNRMLVGLRSFETYVPRGIVERLVAAHGNIEVEAEERELTVLFTDFVGFTTLSEHMDPHEVSAFLNEHLSLIAAAIERHGGTIDKFIGDAVMAFWGAPEPMDPADAAKAACEAARDMAAVFTAHNAERQARGLPRVRMRVGLHSGRVVVGNIGAPGRVNYTVVGDAVNTAQRLESLGKEVDGAAEVCVLMSGRTRELSGVPGSFVSSTAIRGRTGRLDVWRLKQG